MSLINDALKRARESQEKAPPPPPPALEFRPVDPTPMVHPGPSMALIGTVCVAIVLAALLLWQFLRKSPASSTVASAPVVQQAPAPAAVPPPAVAVTPAPGPASAPATAPISTPAKVPVSASVDPRAAITPTPEAPAPVPSAAAAPVQVASAAPAVDPVPPKPAPPKLQAIVFRKTRPSAMISGKTLFVGDKFGDWRLVAISEETATLVGAGVTNVLVLPQ